MLRSLRILVGTLLFFAALRVLPRGSGLKGRC
jgi:hypothetical protein